MSDTIRCPYCVKDGTFRPMKRGFSSCWFVCEECGHTVMEDTPTFECRCQRCKALFSPLKN
jgi:DNA-directed RNA polymerase subunit RPC12/RpoP